jgi:hypothetical protein
VGGRGPRGEFRVTKFDNFLVTFYPNSPVFHQDKTRRESWENMSRLNYDVQHSL